MHLRLYSAFLLLMNNWSPFLKPCLLLCTVCRLLFSDDPACWHAFSTSSPKGHTGWSGSLNAPAFLYPNILYSPWYKSLKTIEDRCTYFNTAILTLVLGCCLWLHNVPRLGVTVPQLADVNSVVLSTVLSSIHFTYLTQSCYYYLLSNHNVKDILKKK